jgi:chemotaxis-related protein WspB
MLFLVCQMGRERYALEASRIVEVLPLLSLKRLPRAPKGVAGVFNYRGQPVPAIDLSELTLGEPAAHRLSTRIIVVNYSDASGQNHLLGIIAEYATELLRREPTQFANPGLKIGNAPYLGPVLVDEQGRTIQCLLQQRLLSEPVENLLFSDAVLTVL